MNLGDLRTRLQWLLAFNQGQAGQDFAGPTNDTNFHIDWLLNEAGKEEVRLGKLVNRSGYKARYSLTWPADATSVAIPEILKWGQVLVITDETGLSSGQTGDPVTFYTEHIAPGGIYRRDTNTWGWYPAPSSALTLSVQYLAEWVPLTAAAQVPTLMPEDMHSLLCWTAAINGRRVADQEAPKQWLDRQTELRYQYHLLLSKGHPAIPAPQITNFNPDIVEAL